MRFIIRVRIKGEAWHRLSIFSPFKLMWKARLSECSQCNRFFIIASYGKISIVDYLRLGTMSEWECGTTKGEGPWEPLNGRWRPCPKTRSADNFRKLRNTGDKFIWVNYCRVIKRNCRQELMIGSFSGGVCCVSHILRRWSEAWWSKIMSLDRIPATNCAQVKIGSETVIVCWEELFKI